MLFYNKHTGPSLFVEIYGKGVPYVTSLPTPGIAKKKIENQICIEQFCMGFQCHHLPILSIPLLWIFSPLNTVAIGTRGKFYILGINYRRCSYNFLLNVDITNPSQKYFGSHFQKESE